MSCGRTLRTRSSVASSFHSLAGVTELEKESDVDARRLQEPRSFANLLDPHTFLHRVEDALRSRLGAHPHHAAVGRHQRSHDLVTDLVGAHQAAEGQANRALLQQVGERAHPPWLQTEHIVDHGELIG